MKLKAEVLPRFVLVGALYSAALGVFHLTLYTACGWDWLAQSVTAAVVSCAKEVALASFLILLSVAARGYYRNDQGVVSRTLPLLRKTSWALCAILAVDWTIVSLHVMTQLSKSTGEWYRLLLIADMLRFPALIGAIVLVVDLLEECLLLRDETAGTV